MSELVFFYNFSKLWHVLVQLH